MSSPRILIVDDDARVRGALRSLLSARSDWSICGEAADGLEAVERAKKLHPDVILMDVSMPRMDGLKAAESIRRDVPESEVILVSQNDPAIVARQAQAVPVRGFVAKSNLVEDLIPTIDRVFASRQEKHVHPNGQQAAGTPEPQRDSELDQQVGRRIGLLPNFFRLAPETPEITEKMWGFAKAAYLDNPLPSLFKERLFVHLSRFCPVRYCIARHVGFLAGMGHASGDTNAPIQSAEEIVLLLRRQLPAGDDLARLLSVYGANKAPLEDLPQSGSDSEEALFAFASHVFLQTPDAYACLKALKTLLGGIRLQYLILLLAFIRSAHYWTQVHPELALEEDVKELLATNEALAECILNDPEAATDVGGRILEELPVLWKEAERATHLLAAIVDSSGDAIVSKDLDGVITSWNHGAERMFGYTAQEAVGQHITLIVPADRLEEETEILARLRRGEMVDHFETVRRRKDGSFLDVSLTISPVRDFSGRVIGASKVARDITEQKRVEQNYRKLAESLEVEVRARTEQVREQHAKVVRNTEVMRSLSRRMLEMQDNERRHIARELHDSAGQTLTVLGISLARLRQELGKRGGSQAAKFAEEAEELARQLSREIRTTSYLLHPPLLDERGLEAALTWYVRGLMDRSGLHIELDIQEEFGRLSPDLELVIFRLVQECLTNIHRHSDSKTALIELERQPGMASLVIEDQGKGISAEKLAALQSDSPGVGIRGMRERVNQFGGQLEITSNGSGTRVAVTLPILTNPESAPESQDSTLQPAG